MYLPKYAKNIKLYESQVCGVDVMIHGLCILCAFCFHDMLSCDHWLVGPLTLIGYATWYNTPKLPSLNFRWHHTNPLSVCGRNSRNLSVLAFRSKHVSFIVWKSANATAQTALARCLQKRVRCPNIKINATIARSAGRYIAVTCVNCFLDDERAEISKGTAIILISASNKKFP